MWHFKVRLEETEQNLWEKIMKPILKTLSSANHRGKNVKTWKPLFTKSSYFYRLHYNLLLYKFSDLKPCSLMEGSKKIFDFLRFNKKMHIHQQQRTNGGDGGCREFSPEEFPPLPIPPIKFPPVELPPVNPPRLISPWRVRVRVSVRVRIHQGEIKQGRVGRGRRHQGVFDRGE